MRTFQNWVDSIGGYDLTAKKIGVSRYAVKHWYTRKGWPKIETIVKIKELSSLSIETIIESTKPTKRK